MANEKNLKPVRTKTEARKRGKAGGEKSGESRRKRKTLREELLLLLSDGETQKSITIALVNKAMIGDVKAFETIRDTVGEKPVDKVMVADVEPSVIEEVEKMVLDDDETEGG